MISRRKNCQWAVFPIAVLNPILPPTFFAGLPLRRTFPALPVRKTKNESYRLWNGVEGFRRLIASMDEEQRLIEKLRKIETLFARTTNPRRTPGCGKRARSHPATPRPNGKIRAGHRV